METVLSLAFEKLGQALGLNLSADSTGGTEENGAICPLDGNIYFHSALHLAVSMFCLHFSA